MCFFLKKKKKKKTKERRCNEYALCSIHEPPSAHVRGLSLSAILLYSFSLMVCSQLDTVATLVFEAVEITCILLPLNVDCNFNFLFSFFSARLRVAQGQERDKVKKPSYDYVSDEKDSTDG